MPTIVSFAAASDVVTVYVFVAAAAAYNYYFASCVTVVATAASAPGVTTVFDLSSGVASAVVGVASDVFDVVAHPASSMKI